MKGVYKILTKKIFILLGLFYPGLELIVALNPGEYIDDKENEHSSKIFSCNIIFQLNGSNDINISLSRQVEVVFLRLFLYLAFTIIIEIEHMYLSDEDKNKGTCVTSRSDASYLRRPWD